MIDCQVPRTKILLDRYYFGIHDDCVFDLP